MQFKIFGLVILITVSGCRSLQNFDSTSLLPPGVSVLSGIAAYKLAEDKDQDEQLLWTAGAAAAGLIGTDLLLKYQDDKTREVCKDYYDLGRSNAVKQQYWIMQARQKEDSNQKRVFKYYKFPGVTTRDGVKYNKHDVIVRMEE